MTLDIGIICVAVLAGIAFGVVHLSLLRAGTRALAGANAVRNFIALAVLRGAVVIGVLAILAALGADAAAFLGVLAGFLVARVAATRMVRARGGTVATWR